MSEVGINDVHKALDSLNYLIEQIIVLMDDAEKAEDWIRSKKL